MHCRSLAASLASTHQTPVIYSLPPLVMTFRNVPRHHKCPENHGLEITTGKIPSYDTLRPSGYVIVLMNSLLVNLICSQQTLERRQSHSVSETRSQSLPGPTHHVCVCYLFFIFCLPPGIFEVDPDSFISQNNWLCSVCCPGVWAVWRGVLPCQNPLHIVLPLPVCLSAPGDVKAHGSRDNDHLVQHALPVGT